ncbi:MAG: hypothetical protein HPY81_07635 [Firmicutes bacterium]|nr:hypothetical protein [Bacillota bacterium]
MKILISGQEFARVRSLLAEQAGTMPTDEEVCRSLLFQEGTYELTQEEMQEMLVCFRLSALMEDGEENILMLGIENRVKLYPTGRLADLADPAENWLKRLADTLHITPEVVVDGKTVLAPPRVEEPGVEVTNEPVETAAEDRLARMERLVVELRQELRAWRDQMEACLDRLEKEFKEIREHQRSMSGILGEHEVLLRSLRRRAI